MCLCRGLSRVERGSRLLGRDWVEIGSRLKPLHESLRGDAMPPLADLLFEDNRFMNTKSTTLWIPKTLDSTICRCSFKFGLARFLKQIYGDDADITLAMKTESIEKIMAELLRVWASNENHFLDRYKYVYFCELDNRTFIFPSTTFRYLG